ncbi:hypothetical protein AHAS_Ahas02G0090700 [Arachis hypogaea]
MLMMIKDGKVSLEDVKHGSNEPCLSCFLECLQDIRVNKESQELLAVEEREEFHCIDREADEWRAREISKDATNYKMKKMKKIAKLKAKEEKKKLEAEINFRSVQMTGVDFVTLYHFTSQLEMVLVVDKLQELRSLRIQKLKKQSMLLVIYLFRVSL